MAEEIKQWEYRVQTIGSVFGTKDEQIERCQTSINGANASHEIHALGIRLLSS
jgi:hypothetical protein